MRATTTTRAIIISATTTMRATTTTRAIIISATTTSRETTTMLTSKATITPITSISATTTTFGSAISTLRNQACAIVQDTCKNANEDVSKTHQGQQLFCHPLLSVRVLSVLSCCGMS